MEKRVTNNLSREFSRKTTRILGVLSKLNEFLLISQGRVHSETASKTSGNYGWENLGHSSQIVAHPEVGHSVKRSPHFVNLEFWEIALF